MKVSGMIRWIRLDLQIRLIPEPRGGEDADDSVLL